MKIFSWNVNGLRAIMTKTFPSLLAVQSPDVMCLQETRMNASVEDSVEVPFKYKFYSHADKKGYSGTAIFSNVEGSRGEAVLLPNHLPEGRITAANIGGINVVSAYVPNSQDALARIDYRMLWDADFRNWLKSMDNLVVCGDFNVAHSDIDICFPDELRGSTGFSDEERSDFDKLLSDVPLVDIWRLRNPDAKDQYTWWSYQGGARWKNWGWRIDYILVSPNLVERVRNAEILRKVRGSDHCPIMIELDGV